MAQRKQRSARDFRTNYERLDPGEILVTHEWYRSPMWTGDHLLGEEKEWVDDELAWCGRPLGAVRDWDNWELGGLWKSDRTGNKCAYCNRRQKEWDAAMRSAGA